MRLVYTVQNLEVQPVYWISEPTSRELSAGVKHVYTVSKPAFRELFARGTASLYSFLTYLKGTV